MNTRLVFAFAALLILSPSLVLAKPMQKTPLKVGAKKANLIVVAELSKHQYESFKDGETKTLYTGTLWKQYNVVKVLKNSTGQAIPLKTVIQATDKCNGCIRSMTAVTRNKDAFRLVTENSKAKAQLLSLKSLKAKQGTRVVLFLTISAKATLKPVLQSQHYGWFLSGTKWTADYEKVVAKAVHKEKGA